MKMRVRKNLREIDERLHFYIYPQEEAMAGIIITVVPSIHRYSNHKWYACEGFRDWCEEELEPTGTYDNEEEI